MNFYLFLFSRQDNRTQFHLKSPCFLLCLTVLNLHELGRGYRLLGFVSWSFGPVNLLHAWYPTHVSQKPKTMMTFPSNPHMVWYIPPYFTAKDVLERCLNWVFFFLGGGTMEIISYPGVGKISLNNSVARVCHLQILDYFFLNIYTYILVSCGSREAVGF